MEGCEDFSPKVSPDRLWFNANLWSNVEEGEKLEHDTRYDVYIQIQKIEGQKSPLLLFTVPRGESSGPQGDGY